MGLVLAFLVGWEVVGRTSGGYFVAPFSTTVGHVVELARDGELGRAEWQSNLALIIGFPIAAVAGVAVGLLFGRKRLVDRAFSYFMDIMLVVPMIAVVPVIIMAFGLGTTARVAVVILFALPVIALNSRAAVRVLDQPLVEMSVAFGASKRQLWQTVILPASVGVIFTGLRIGLARGIAGMIVIELTLIPVGLGGMLVTFQSEFASADLYAVTLIIMLEGLILVGLAHYAEGLLLRRLQGRSRA